MQCSVWSRRDGQTIGDSVILEHNKQCFGLTESHENAINWSFVELMALWRPQAIECHSRRRCCDQWGVDVCPLLIAIIVPLETNHWNQSHSTLIEVNLELEFPRLYRSSDIRRKSLRNSNPLDSWSQPTEPPELPELSQALSQEPYY